MLKQRAGCIQSTLHVFPLSFNTWEVDTHVHLPTEQSHRSSFVCLPWLIVNIFLAKLIKRLALFPPLGYERIQMRRLLQRVHPLRQSEEAHADPRQREALPVPRLFQDLRPEADPENAHDRAPAGQAFQMQGELRRAGASGTDPATRTGADVMTLSLRCVASPSTECTTSSDTCTSMPAASRSSALTAPASSTWRETSADTWRSNTA